MNIINKINKMSDRSDIVGLMYDQEDLDAEVLEHGTHIVENPQPLGRKALDDKAWILACAQSARKGVLDLPMHIGGLRGLLERAAQTGYLEPNSVLSYAAQYNGTRRGGLTSSGFRDYWF